MKCQHCRYLPAAGPEGDYDECPYYEKYGTVWKDGQDGCTLRSNQIEKFEDGYAEYLGNMGTDMGVDIDLECKSVSKTKVIELCKHIIGMDNNKTYRRNGKQYYKPNRNYFEGQQNELDAMPDYLVEKRKSESGETVYSLTDEGKMWLGRNININIKV